MPVTVKTISTKPTGVVWFRQTSPENAAAWATENEWTAAQPGFISQEHVEESENVSSYSVTFDVVENYRAWRDTRETTAMDAARVAHYTDNNITFERVYIQL